MSVLPDLKSLHEVDDSLWLEETIALLKEKKFDALDLENLIEELEDLANEKKFRIADFLDQIIRYSLFLQFWQEEREKKLGDWSAEIFHFQNQIKRYITPNLYQYLEREFASIYEDAAHYVLVRTNHRVICPKECPYTLENLLDSNWLGSIGIVV